VLDGGAILYITVSVLPQERVNAIRMALKNGALPCGIVLKKKESVKSIQIVL